jgi:hypothetical protein
MDDAKELRGILNQALKTRMLEGKQRRTEQKK